MSTVSKLSAIYGENVTLSEENTVATWTPKHSGGWAFCENDFHPGDTVNVKVDGSGRCDIGFIKGNENNWTPTAFKILNEIRAHRRTCDIPVTLDTNGEEISSQFNDRKFKKKVDKGEKIRIAVNILYGEMNVELSKNGLSDNSLKFSAILGPNIQLENDNTKVSSIRRNPASICLLADKLTVGQVVSLHCSPIKEGDREPGRYGLRLFVSDKAPQTLKKEQSYLFDPRSTYRDSCTLKEVENLEKEDCNGSVTITLSSEGVIQYTAAKGKRNQQNISMPTENGIWLAFDLYRVILRVATIVSGAENQQAAAAVQGCDDVDAIKFTLGEPLAEGNDIPDSLPLSPRPKSVSVEPANPTDVLHRLKSVEEQLAEIKRRTSTGSLGSASSLEQSGQVEKTLVRSSNQNQREECIPVQVPTAPAYNEENIGNDLNVQRHYADLVKVLEPVEFTDHMYSKEIITLAQMEEMQTLAKTNRQEANRVLLRLMSRQKDIIKKSEIKECLEKTNQQHLLQHFYPKK